MKTRLAVLVFVICLLSGCTGKKDATDRAVAMRANLLNSNGCTFQCGITADYGEKIYTFQMNCQADAEGNITFTVTEPDTLNGICGKISNLQGALTFEDRVLAFETIADDYLTPVSSPWVFLKTLRSGYISACTQTETGLCLYIDDTYAESSAQLRIYTDNNAVPTGAEIFWQNRRILTLQVDNFTLL